MSVIIKAAVTYKKAADGADYVKVGLEGGLNFLMNNDDPVLRKFIKGYILTLEVTSFDAGFSKPKDENTKSLKAMVDWTKGLKGFVNMRGVKITGIEKATTCDFDIDELPDVDTSLNSVATSSNHLRLVGKV